jgi:monothiol glutaredoxin
MSRRRDCSEEECARALEELKRIEKMIVYEEQNETFVEMSNEVGDDFVMVDLGISELLRNSFMKEYGVTSLPVIIVGNTKIYAEGFEEKWRELQEKEEKREVDKALDLIRGSKMALFIKGSPSFPQCGFTTQLMRILEEEGIGEETYGWFNILSSQGMREGLKKHSRWPTYPQIYIKGEFVGGLDVLKRLREVGGIRRLLE